MFVLMCYGGMGHLGIFIEWKGALGDRRFTAGQVLCSLGVVNTTTPRGVLIPLSKVSWNLTAHRCYSDVNFKKILCSTFIPYPKDTFKKGDGDNVLSYWLLPARDNEGGVEKSG